MNFKIFLDNYFPFTVRLILIKALLYFVLYKFVLSFNLNFINYPITTNVGEYATKLLNYSTNSQDFSVSNEYVYKWMDAKSSQIYFKDRKLVFIADSCNSLLASLRYIGLIFCFPSRFWRKALYIFLGIIIIHLLNIVRCAGLAYINLYHQTYFHDAHNFWFKWVVYGPVTVIWLFYLRKVQIWNTIPNKEKDIA